MTEEQWELIDDKYGMLMAKICHQISGDTAVCSYDDNLQDLRMTAIDAVDGFERQHGGTNGKFDEFWGTKGFDRYIKTCLWTKKNNKGAKVTKKLGVTKAVPIEDAFNMEGATSTDIENSVFFADIRSQLTKQEKKVLDAILEDHTMIKPGGRINIRKLSKELGVSWAESHKIVRNLGIKIGNEL